MHNHTHEVNCDVVFNVVYIYFRCTLFKVNLTTKIYRTKYILGGNVPHNCSTTILYSTSITQLLVEDTRFRAYIIMSVFGLVIITHVYQMYISRIEMQNSQRIIRVNVLTPLLEYEFYMKK